MTLTWKSAVLWGCVLTAFAASGLRHSPWVLAAVVLLVLTVRFRWLSKVEAWLQAGLFPPRKPVSLHRGQYRYRRGGPRLLAFHAGHPPLPRMSARELANDKRRDQVVSAIILDTSSSDAHPTQHAQAYLAALETPQLTDQSGQRKSRLVA